MVGKAGEKINQELPMAKEKIIIVHLLAMLVLGIVISSALSTSFDMLKHVIAFREKGSLL